MPNNPFVNLQNVERIAQALGDLNDEVIFVGGAIVGLYATDSAAEEARPTEDIDISVKVSSYREMNQLSELLSEKDIHPDVESSIMYRYKYKGISIDFIPFEDTSVGPTNRWLKPSFAAFQSVKIGRETIHIPPVSLFLATKWEAYQSRGTDPRTSKDFEDIIYVLDNNIELVAEVGNSDRAVRMFLVELADFILQHSSKDEIIECHLNPFSAEERKNLILEKLTSILAMN